MTYVSQLLARFSRGEFSLSRTVYALTPLFYITPWDYHGAHKR